MPLKIGIVGKMCSGKSTTAFHLRELNSLFHINSFAKKVKELAVELFGMKEKNRTLLIQIGEGMRKINDTVWVDYTIKECNKHNFAIIDDVRHFNEYQALKVDGWKIIKLKISDELQEQRLKKNYPNDYETHMKHLNNITETGAITLDDDCFDLVIDVDKDQNNMCQLLYDFYITTNM